MLYGWTYHNSLTHTVRHNVRTFRDILDNMKPSEFTWMLYNYWSELMLTMLRHCGREYWRANCPLLNYHIVEQLNVYLCMRQFGQVQDIPTNLIVPHKVFHATIRKGKGGHDWEAHHAKRVESWFSRRGQSVEAPIITNPNRGIVPGYDRWYASHTRQLITPPSRHIEIRYQPTEVDAWLTVENNMHQLSLSCDAQSASTNLESYRCFVDSTKDNADGVYLLAQSILDCSYKGQKAQTIVRSQYRRHNPSGSCHDEAGASRTHCHEAGPSGTVCDEAAPSRQQVDQPSPYMP